MNQARLIHRYLDGEVNGNEEDFLFNELSRNPEMRQEFNQQIKIHVITQNDMNSISPPIESTNALFSALGFSIPSGNFINRISSNESAKSKPGTIPFGKKLQGHVSTLIIAILSSALTAFILFLLFNSFIKPEIASLAESFKKSVPVLSSFQNDKQQNSVAAQSAAPHERDYSGIIRDAIRKEFGNYFVDLKTLENRYLAALNSNQDRTLTENTDNYYYNYIFPKEREIYHTNDMTYSNRAFPIVPKDRNITMNLINPTSSGFVYTPYYPEFANSRGYEQGDNTNWAISFRSTTSHGTPNFNIGNSTNQWFTDLSLGVKYKVNNYHSFGVEGGQERYSQEFSRMIEGKKFEQKQSPLLWWYGAIYKYSARQLSISNRFYPYAQVFTGGTVAGPLGKVQLGIQYQPAENVTFNLGAEASRLWYNIQGTTYSTDKMGVTYGLSIHY
jgi:hypothetical protein